MTYGSNLQTTQLNASGAVTASGVPCHVSGIWVNAGTSAGTVVLKNGGSAGTTIATFNVPAVAANANGMGFLSFGQMGINFPTDCYCTITNVSFVTVLWY